MKILKLLFVLSCLQVFGQQIGGIQLFNPKTNDETAVIGFNEQLILRFDDFSNSSTVYRYTLKHFDRNWQDDGLFFTEFANGSLNGLIDQFKYSFNTYQKYTHYELTFPNERISPKISGNFEIIVYNDSQDRPLFTKRFCMVENRANIGMEVSRFQDARQPNLRQRIQAQVTTTSGNIMDVVNSVSLSVIQNNNWQQIVQGLRPSSTLGNQLLFQQMNLAFPGNNQFYYFDNKIIDHPVDMVAKVDQVDGIYQTILYPVWAYPQNYQYQPDVHGAFYFRRNDLGIERDASTEGDYSWVNFSLESHKMEKDLYVLGQFNSYKADQKSKMQFDAEHQMYFAKIYLKQGFYNYILATQDTDGTLNYGEINGNFWQTNNLYQGFLYYTPFGRNYDGLLGYGELRPVAQ